MTNFVDLALPGMLPVLNEECLDLAIKASLALKGKINHQIKFDRKHYFYSDLPQGYQITQKDHPIMERGKLYYFDRLNQQKSLTIQRIQIEQDSAKSFHDFDNYALIDYNRAGMPLLEIVTEPEIDHPEDGKLVVKEIQELLKALELSEANMEEGQMRCDVNISVRDNERGIQGNRVEVKNVLGAKFVEKAIEYELMRHVEMIEKGQNIVKETRRYDSINDKTISMRSKEQDPDYRFFQDPDLPCIIITPDRIRNVENKIKKTPFERKVEFQKQFNLDIIEVQNVFSSDKLIYIFEKLVDLNGANRLPKDIYNWIFVFVNGQVIKKDLNLFEIIQSNCKDGQYIADLIDLVKTEKLQILNAKDILYRIIDGDGRIPIAIAESLNMIKSDELNYNKIIDKVLEQNKITVDKIKQTGKDGQVMFLVGQTMKAINKKGDPQKIQQIIREKLGLK
ncbi:aspartyl glutamyl-trna amidotransferase subunit b [Stylonychia lemnae]|uniref:Glutamyl-tRNA(Gln) amidotransferase subunit B, mitochondrial n=1 Tax=Stylonychia lemnae TaxID=5949 RepID=A0A078ATV6_STYLE|nr:aspartyl glutamyl-trna amidotransferase subunit b [Stylonychia lemnae]|eukprot:CDW85381.1 aspartyl glutamyl-trna amidotransferase subunit b [Stylonychia lemnae]